MNSFNRLMNHKVVPMTVQRDGFGSENVTQLNEEKGFFEYGKRLVYNNEGEEVTSRALLFLKKDSQYDPTLKDGDAEMKWRFKDVKNDRVMDLEDWDVIDDPRTGRTHHYELHLR